MSVGATAPPMRLGGKGGNVKAQATKVAAWIAYVTAVAAGALLAGTFIGGLIDNLVTVGPAWLPVVALIVLFVSTAVDLGVDGVPNRVALYCTMAMPSVARSVNGKLGNNVEHWANQVLDQIRGPLSAWLGTSSALALALAAGLAAWLVARRTMAAKAAGSR